MTSGEHRENRGDEDSWSTPTAATTTLHVNIDKTEMMKIPSQHQQQQSLQVDIDKTEVMKILGQQQQQQQQTTISQHKWEEPERNNLLYTTTDNNQPA
ncbi:unnamed protein product [Trichobilharzia regenti]|nr:unnamed protein product [Trichobilharzia regenti]